MCVTCGCETTARHEPNPRTIDGEPLPEPDAARTLRLQTAVLGANDRIAAANRAHFAAHGVTALNLISSPGSGKTSLLVETIRRLRTRAPALPVAVIEGDQQTSNDALRIRAAGAPAIQVNTGKGCHLDAAMIAAAFARLPLHDHGHDHGPAHGHGHRPADGRAEDAVHRPRAEGGGLLFVENVGNLVCPASWDLGEAAKVIVLSVTEGEDKPSKYPDAFAAASLMVLNKVDLLPYVDFDVERCIELARRVNPHIEVLRVSARSGEGLDDWIDRLLQPFPRPAERMTDPLGDRAIATAGAGTA
jgi:hydrogenase nickel incorporation protein HypB